ncbi:ion transporter [Halostreptopolyspora alba]|uniref:Ion transporter n=1 Tax=Halostreptopolyspora alba TaxID=2487137 RepID=A0A3N0E4T7_9ACTN|nr:ion transporter [Nocardiopsaceae bacterium YIM 96095]
MAQGVLRARVSRAVDSQWFQHTVVAVILLNAITLGLESYEREIPGIQDRLALAEHVFVTAFVVELVLRIYAGGTAFFRGPWNWFDLIVVSVTLVPASSESAVLRLLRTLRILRLVSVLPTMRHVVSALFRSLPGMGTVIGLLLVIIYTAAIMGQRLFDEIAPEYFGDVGTSLYTLFMVLTTEDWPDVADAVMAQEPMAWIFFVVYMVVSAFIALNLVIGVIVTAMEHEVNQQRWADDQELELEQHREVVNRLGALTAQVEQLSEQVRVLRGAAGESERESGNETREGNTKKQPFARETSEGPRNESDGAAF